MQQNIDNQNQATPKQDSLLPPLQYEEVTTKLKVEELFRYLEERRENFKKETKSGEVLASVAQSRIAVIKAMIKDYTEELLK